jgi:hypothetical protein
MILRVPHPWFLRVGSYNLTPLNLFVIALTSNGVFLKDRRTKNHTTPRPSSKLRLGVRRLAAAFPPLLLRSFTLLLLHA